MTSALHILSGKLESDRRSGKGKRNTSIRLEIEAAGKSNIIRAIHWGRPPVDRIVGMNKFAKKPDLDRRSLARHLGLRRPRGSTWRAYQLGLYPHRGALFLCRRLPFYSKWIAARVLALNDRRATPCEVQDDGKDFVKTNKWIVFGHHFAAISGPGPLVGPVLAAQFGYLPGTLWILIGVVLGGAVQDFVILFCSMRRTESRSRR